MPDDLTSQDQSPIKNSKSVQARINGAKSAGPKSSTGKEKTSWNTLKHGFRSDRDVIHGESQQTYNDLAQAYHRYFTPQTIIEHDLVSNLISARWRYRRAQMMESCTFNLTMARSEAEWDEEFEDLPTEYRHTLAFHGSLKSKDHNLNIESLSRWEERFDGRWRRSILMLQKLRGKNNPFPPMDNLLEAEAKLPNNYGDYPSSPDPLIDPMPPDSTESAVEPGETPVPAPTVETIANQPEPEAHPEPMDRKCTPDPACPPVESNDMPREQYLAALLRLKHLFSTMTVFVLCCFLLANAPASGSQPQIVQKCTPDPRPAWLSDGLAFSGIVHLNKRSGSPAIPVPCGITLPAPHLEALTCPSPDVYCDFKQHRSRSSQEGGPE